MISSLTDVKAQREIEGHTQQAIAAHRAAERRIKWQRDQRELKARQEG